MHVGGGNVLQPDPAVVAAHMTGPITGVRHLAQATGMRSHTGRDAHAFLAELDLLEGRQLLETSPSRLNLDCVQTLPTCQQWQDGDGISVNNEGSLPAGATLKSTPEEEAENACQCIEAELQADLLARVRQCHRAFLNRLLSTC